MNSIVTWPYVLRRGHSKNPAEGACAMAAISWLMHGIHSDAPKCASPAITNYVIGGNDAMPDEVRQRLLPYLHRIAGSRSDAHEATRVRILWLAAVRVFAPIALDAAGLNNHAKHLRDLPDDVTPKRARKAATWAARAAAATWAAAEAATWAAAEAATWAAAEAAAAVLPSATWAAAATWAARAAAEASGARAWDAYFNVLDAVLNAGPQGEAWSADVMDTAVTKFEMASGR